jgi:succinyl-CoA synthetase beta subunit
VKPDQLFGKRGKHGLLGIDLTVDEVIAWIKEKN